METSVVVGYPLGHNVPATLFIARFMRNNISGDDYEMICKVARA